MQKVRKREKNGAFASIREFAKLTKSVWPHIWPELRNLLFRTLSTKNLISGCGPVGRALDLGAGALNRFDRSKCLIHPHYSAKSRKFFRWKLGKTVVEFPWPHIWPQRAIFLNLISGYSPVGRAPHLGAGALNRFDHSKCCMLPFIFANTPDYFRRKLGKNVLEFLWPHIWPQRAFFLNSISGYSPVGRAPHLGCGSRAFESRYSDQNRQFSLRKLAVLTFLSIFCFLFIAVHSCFFLYALL